VFVPILMVGVAASAITFILGETLVPIGNRKATIIRNQIFYRQAVPGLADELFFKLQEHFIYIERVVKEGDHKRAEHIMVCRPSAFGAGGGEFIIARSGTSTNGRRWELHDAVIYHFDAVGHLISVEPGDRGKSRCILDLEQDPEDYRQYVDAIGSPLAGKMGFEMSMREIAKERKKFADSKIRAILYDVDYYSKTAVPCACLIFALVAAPLCFLFARSGNFVGILIAVVVLFFYYIMWTMGQKIGQLGIVHPFLAAWSQNLLFGALGVVLLYRIE